MGIVLLIAAGAVSPAGSQQSGMQTQAYPGNYPPPLARRKTGAPPRLVFEVISEITLPGPLRDAPIEISEAGARVPLVDSDALVPLEPGSEPLLSPATPAKLPSASDPDSAWTLSSDGKLRYQTRVLGLLVAQKRCRRCREGWKPAWSLRVPGATRSPPTVQGRRLFFAASDGRVYCLRSDNGHRIWAVDVGDRVSRPLVLWSGVIPDPEGPWAGSATRPLDLVLVITDGGGALYALDPYDGGRVGILELPPERGRLKTGVAAAPDGRIVVGRETYATADGTLMVLRLTPAKDSPPAADAKPESSERPMVE